MKRPAAGSKAGPGGSIPGLSHESGKKRAKTEQAPSVNREDSSLSTNERLTGDRLGVACVLRRTFDVLCEHHYPDQIGLIEALQSSWGPNSDAANAWIARHLLVRLSDAVSLQQWEANRANTHEDALRLVCRGIEACGFSAPPIPTPVFARAHRRGGWRISHGRVA